MTLRTALLVLVVLIPTAVVAQVDRAALTGIVHDASGAIIPAAFIKLTPSRAASSARSRQLRTGPIKSPVLWLANGSSRLARPDFRQSHKP